MGYARRERRIVCSAVYQEVDILPLRAELESRGRLEGPTRVSSEKLERANQRQRERHFAQLVAANFVRPGVLLVDMTYAPGMEPESFEAADANMVRYLRRIKYLCRQRALPAPLYVAVTEGGNEGGEEENKRLHHHMILFAPGLGREEVEGLWSTGRGRAARSLGRVNTRAAQPEHGSLEGRAKYMLKAPRHKRRWHQSLGLKKPVRKINDEKYNAHQIEQWVRDGRALDPAFWRRKYPSWQVAEVEAEYNEIEGVHYIRLKLWREASPWKKPDTRAGRTRQGPAGAVPGGKRGAMGAARCMPGTRKSAAKPGPRGR